MYLFGSMLKLSVESESRNGRKRISIGAAQTVIVFVMRVWGEATRKENASSVPFLWLCILRATHSLLSICNINNWSHLAIKFTTLESFFAISSSSDFIFTSCSLLWIECLLRSFVRSNWIDRNEMSLRCWIYVGRIVKCYIEAINVDGN